MASDSLKRFILRWGPVFLMMGLIFLFSSIPNKSHLPAVEPLKLDRLTLLRKSGHLLEYGLLALALQRGLRLSGWKGAIAILGCVLLFALSDEFHQSFVLGRTASMIDVGIDMIGIILGLVIDRILGKVPSGIIT